MENQLINFDAENFIRVFVDIFYDGQVEVVEIMKKKKEGAA